MYTVLLEIIHRYFLFTEVEYTNYVGCTSRGTEFGLAAPGPVPGARHGWKVRS